ncbi:MAG TPA: peptidase S8 [Paenibacillaceae bacterium]|nr:peptidase S8 [Paenibacillaceae bacterium]
MVRNSRNLVDQQLRQKIISLYKPMRWIPCFMHKWIEGGLKRTKRVPVIVEFKDGNCFASGLEELHTHTKRKMGSNVKHEYPNMACCSAKLSYHVLENILQNTEHIKKIHFDRPIQALLDVASPSVKANILNQQGLTGKGVTIAVVDTGVAPHTDLTTPTNRIVAFQDFINGRTAPYDDNGHGTHCAGCALGNGRASNGKYKGMAPEAHLVGVKVLDRNGSGFLSTLIAGVEWCIQNKNQYNIKVISLSLGSQATQSAKDDPMVKVVEKAWNAGIVVVVAAGNEGSEQGTISSPGISPKVITVGAMNDANTIDRKDDVIAKFSSRGPTIDGLIKPDLLAPGVDIISLRSNGSSLDKNMKSNRRDNDYFILSGTSMATPICAGVVAVILQQHPQLTPDQVKDQLLSKTEDRGYPPNVQGKGYLSSI